MKYLTRCLEGQQCDSSEFHDLPEEPLISVLLKKDALLPWKEQHKQRSEEARWGNEKSGG